MAGEPEEAHLVEIRQPDVHLAARPVLRRRLGAASWARATGTATGASPPSNRASSNGNTERKRVIRNLLAIVVARGSVRADGAVLRVLQRVHYGEEALGQLVGLALADLVGLDRHQGVVPALRLRR